MTLLEAKDLTVRFGNHTIVDRINLSVDEGQWLMLVGPNGAGKSTIVSAISQTVSYTGTIRYINKDIKSYKPYQLARNIGVLSQSHHVGYSFTVGEIVRLGRYAYARGIFPRHSSEDEQKVIRALEITGMLPLINQSVLTLSGGELQRTFLAQLFAQDPKILILDEPTNHLDLVYQKQTFELIGQWLQSKGRAVISVVHDLSLAKAYGSNALLLDNGRMIASGKIHEVFSRENLNKAYSIDVFEWMRQMNAQWQD